jgi:hypothetical protein
VTFVPKLRPPTRNPLLHPPLAHCYGQEFLPSLGNVRYRRLHGRYQHADDSEGPGAAVLARTADTTRLRRVDPLESEHVNRYGRFDLDMNARLALLLSKWRLVTQLLVYPTLLGGATKTLWASKKRIRTLSIP